MNDDQPRRLTLTLKQMFIIMKNYLWLFVLGGIWLIIAPFALDYSQTISALWNDIIVGIIVSAVAIFGYSQKID